MEKWEKYLSAIEDNWSRSGSLSHEDLPQALAWCQSNCTGEWVSFNNRIYIKESQDATFFLLKWS